MLRFILDCSHIWKLITHDDKVFWYPNHEWIISKLHMRHSHFPSIIINHRCRVMCEETFSPKIKLPYQKVYSTLLLPFLIVQTTKKVEKVKRKVEKKKNQNRFNPKCFVEIVKERIKANFRTSSPSFWHFLYAYWNLSLSDWMNLCVRTKISFFHLRDSLRISSPIRSSYSMHM